MSETAIEERFRLRVEARGGFAFKLLPWAESGLPDRLVLLPGRRMFFVELKTPTGTLRPSQRRVRRKLASLGFTVWVVATLEDQSLFFETVDSLS